MSHFLFMGWFQKVPLMDPVDSLQAHPLEGAFMDKGFSTLLCVRSSLSSAKGPGPSVTIIVMHLSCTFVGMLWA